MATTIRIQLRGEAEKLVKKLSNKYGLSEQEVISRALGLLKVAEETQRVALLKPQDQIQQALGSFAATPPAVDELVDGMVEKVFKIV
jgi:hypothetical protein